MQLSSTARKAVAVGLAASTLLWAAGLGFAPLVASADVHTDGCLVLSGGIVWMITGGTRRGFTSAEVFQSYGYNFGEVVAATSDDVNLPVGPIMTYADGTLVMDPSLSPLVYLVAGGQKDPFVSGDVFTGLGFSFSNIQTAPANTFSDLPVGSNVDNAAAAHRTGTLVISNGAIWQMTANGRMGFPTAAAFTSFGYNFAHVVQANAADLALPDQGAIQARPGCSTTSTGTGTTPVTTGSVSATLASDNPVSNTVVSGQSTADLAHFLFSGSGAVTQLTLQRLGVSSNNLLTNVYLYNGNLRITDGSAVNSNGQIVFNNSTGLFNAPAEISVRADIQSGQSGQTVGVGIVSGMSGTLSVAGVPQGNLFTVANPANLATVVFQANTVGNSNVNAGSMNYTIWSAPVTVGNRSVWLKTVMLKAIGSANTDALQNYILYVDGNQVATASGLTTINGSNYAVFDLSAAPYSLQTGSHTLEARADIIKGSARTIQFTLQNAADITVTDSSYNVNVTPNTTNTSTLFSPNQAGTLSIQSGSVAVQLDPTFGSTNTVAGGATNVPLAKFNLTGYGEDVQINTLQVTFAGSAISGGLNNVALYSNGAQVGSTQQLAASATTVTFNLGSALIIPAGQTVNLSVQADTINAANSPVNSGTVTVSLVAASSNVSNSQGRSSQSVLSVPNGTVTANQLTIGAGGLTVASNPAFLNQTLSPNMAATRVGSFVIQAGNNEPIRISNLAIGLTRTDGITALTNTEAAGTAPALTDFSNLKVSVNGGTPSNPIQPQASNNFSQNFTIPQNGTATIDVWADLGTEGGNDAFATTLLPTATGTISNTIATPGSSTAGQHIILAAGALNTATQSGATALPALISSATQPTQGPAGSAVFNFTSATGSQTIQELKFNVANNSGTPLANAVTQITVNGVTSPVVHVTGTGAGTVSTAGTTAVTGVGTAFLSTFKVGDSITIGSTTGVITAITTDTALVTSATTWGTVSGSAYTFDNGYIADVSFSTPITVSASVAGGVDLAAVPTYNFVSTANTGGITTNTQVKIGLAFVKYQTGSSTSTVYYSGASGAPATAYANSMVLVASQPIIAGTATNTTTIQKNSGLVSSAGVDVIEFTISNPGTSPVRVRQIAFTPFWSGTLTNSAADVVQLYDPSNSSTILNSGQANINLGTTTSGGGTQKAVVLDQDLIIAAGATRTLRIKMDTTLTTPVTGNSIRVDLTNSGESYGAVGAAVASEWAWNDSTVTGNNYLDGYLLKNLNVTGPTQSR